MENNDAHHPRIAKDAVSRLQQQANRAQTALEREPHLPRLFCNLHSKQVQLAFYLIRPIFVYTVIKDIGIHQDSNFPLANAVDACSSTEKETANFLLHSLSHRHVRDPLLYQNEISVLNGNTIYLRQFKNLNARTSHAELIQFCNHS